MWGEADCVGSIFSTVEVLLLFLETSSVLCFMNVLRPEYIHFMCFFMLRYSKLFLKHCPL